ncbi:MAG TPA: hypothetical protein VFE58_07360 [Tepidisphaeraceae bacterium]|jgi:hypothetical protein|nr:hypothetical protein [Tepidisphaeraceae bacterium]
MAACIRLFIVSLLAIILTGCSTAEFGGAPPPSFDVDKDLAQLSKQFDEPNAIPSFYANPSVDARNKFIGGRLTLMNIRYIQFIRHVTNDRQALESATDILVIGLNVAGAATGGATEKTVLSAISAGILGSKAVIEKEYFYEKTMPALIAAMNAQRKAALVPILQGSKTNSLQDYPFEQAVSDLNDYYLAGTLLGAVQAIEADAGKKETDQNAALEDIRLSPAYEATTEQLRRQLTVAIGKLAAADLAKAQTAVAALASVPTVFPTPPADIDAAKLQLQAKVRNARKKSDADAIAQAFTAAGISY